MYSFVHSFRVRKHPYHRPENTDRDWLTRACICFNFGATLYIRRTIMLYRNATGFLFFVAAMIMAVPSMGAIDAPPTARKVGSAPKMQTQPPAQPVPGAA